MREIKFRLWCKDLEEMTEIEKMGFENNQLWYIGCIDHDKEETYFPENDDHVLMQYTGSKDANGVEIFEGDILQSVDDESYMSAVKYCTDGVGSCGCCYDEFEGAGFKAKDLRFKESVVVGNIYENPELLGDSQ